MTETLDKIKSITISVNEDENDITIDYVVETMNADKENFVIARYEAQSLLYRALAKIWEHVLDQTGSPANQIQATGQAKQFKEMLNASKPKPSTKHSNPAQLKLL